MIARVSPSPDCVPTDTAILTRQGFIRYGDLREGDETLGYNLSTCSTEWTPIRAVKVCEDADVVQAGIKRWKVECSPHHSWVTIPQRKTAARLEPLNEIPQGSTLVLAAPANTHESLPITDAEAEILAWAEVDGSIRVRGNGRWQSSPPGTEMNVTQSKPEYVVHIKRLLAAIPHTESVRELQVGRGFKQNHEQHVWYLPAAYARDLLRRAGYFDLSPEERVLAMSPSQRSAWLRGMDAGEGTHRTNGDSRMVLTQNRGPLLDAIALCMYLLGTRPSYQDHGSSRRVAATKPVTAMVRAQFSVEPSRPTRVWCPTTGLGSWTARQGDHMIVTGDIPEPWGLPPRSCLLQLGTDLDNGAAS